MARLDKSGWWIPEGTVESKHPVNRRKSKRAVIPLAVRFARKRRTVIQAGGHLGLWPKALATHFRRVWTFEAAAENHECLTRNVTEANITVHRAALGDREATVGIELHPTLTGSHFVADVPGDCRMRRIDDLGLVDIDAIFLDIEGYEIYALRGAKETIARNKPVIVCEENTCCLRYGFAYGDIARELAPYGYREVARYKQDIIFRA